MPKGEKSVGRHIIAENISKYKTYKELPLVSTGCDSYASWDVRFKDLSPMLTVDAIVDRIMEMLPYNHWESEHLVITGGEPLLGWQRAYPALLSHPKMAGLKEITFETNGSQWLYPEVKDYLFDEFTRVGRDYDRLTFSVSPKLPCSGESWESAINPTIVKSYEMIGYTYLKFVVATREDVDDAERAVEEYRHAGFGGPVYLMPVGGVRKPWLQNMTRLPVIRPTIAPIQVASQ
jgi:organic radical activating enzyme